MAELSDRPLGELLAQVASPTPAPGAGCSLAWTCALAAGLVQMTAGVALARGGAGESSPGRPLEQLAARAATLQAQALAIGEDELHAYGPVLAALRLPESSVGRRAGLQAALAAAAEGPLALARIAAELTALATAAAAHAGRHLEGDALAGCLLAEAAGRAAAELARINLAGAPEDERLRELDELTEVASRMRAQALSDAPA
jgi:formiminotetrahydrofolate cyclodeaminase